MAKFKEEKDIEDRLREFFSEILNERGNRLVVFIDELDRCRPSYAVQLLERIKHYLEDDRITFVFSVNLAELQHTVKHYYGNEFDACRYLDRFFDLRIELPPADLTAFYSKIGLGSSYTVETVCRRVIEYYGFQLRDTTRYYRTVRTAIYEPTHESRKWDFTFSDGKARQLVLLYIVPVVIGLRIANIEEYQAFMMGKSPETLINIFANSDIGHWAVEDLLNNDESFIEGENKKLVTKEDKLRELYTAIFVDEYTGNSYCKTMGKYQFDNKSKQFVKRVASMLSQYTDLTV
nr:P-loop NTPase fold protein [Pseudobutyrivibrio sp.]